MRRTLIVISAILLLIISTTGCSNQKAEISNVNEYGDAAKLLTEVKTIQFFTDEKVSNEDVEKILSAGVNAPSAMNTQPWHFTAVTDEEIVTQLADAMTNMKPPSMQGDTPITPPANAGEKQVSPTAMPDNISKAPDGKDGFSKAANKAGIGDAPLTIVISCKEGSEFDAGLAVQNMSAEAQLLGYGTKIMTAPTMALNNDEYKEMLSVPEGQKVAAVLIVGKAATEEDNPDAVSSATTRNDFPDVVTIISE